MEKRFVKILEKICGGLLVMMVLLLFSQVTTRYIFRGSLLWAGEMAVWLFVWITYLGSVVLYINKKHIIVDIVSNLLPKKINDVLELISSVIVFLFLLVLFYQSIPVVISYSKQTATSIEVSKRYLFSSLTVSTFLMIVYTLYAFIQKIRRR
jgi:TRAP-type transport system small permease protein